MPVLKDVVNMLRRSLKCQYDLYDIQLNKSPHSLTYTRQHTHTHRHTHTHTHTDGHTHTHTHTHAHTHTHTHSHTHEHTSTQKHIQYAHIRANVWTLSFSYIG